MADFQTKVEKLRAEKMQSGMLYDWTYLTEHVNYYERQELIGFIALATMIFTALVLNLGLKKSGRYMYLYYKRVSWAPRDLSAIAIAVCYLMSLNAAATVMAVVQPTHGSWEKTMVSFAVTQTLLGMYMLSYALMGDLSLSLLAIMMQIAVLVVQINLLSDSFIGAQICLVFILFGQAYLFSIVGKQWIATELPLAMKQLNLKKEHKEKIERAVKVVSTGKMGGGDKKGKKHAKMPPTAAERAAAAKKS